MNYRISIQSLAIISLLGCHSYTPMPVDLDEHLAAFEHRTPTVPSDGALTRAVARELAKMFHPDARLARRRAGVATAQRDHAGAWTDPQLQTNLQRILESVAYQGVATAQIGFTLPINGRLQRQRELADRRRDVALVAAWATEQQVANDLDEAWVDWTTASQRAAVFSATSESLQQLEHGLSEAGAGLTLPSGETELQSPEQSPSHIEAGSQEQVSVVFHFAAVTKQLEQNIQQGHVAQIGDS